MSGFSVRVGGGGAFPCQQIHSHILVLSCGVGILPTLSAHPICPPYLPTLSARPICPPYLPTLSKTQSILPGPIQDTKHPAHPICPPYLSPYRGYRGQARRLPHEREIKFLYIDSHHSFCPLTYYNQQVFNPTF